MQTTGVIQNILFEFELKEWVGGSEKFVLRTDLKIKRLLRTTTNPCIDNTLLWLDVEYIVIVKQETLSFIPYSDDSFS